MDIVTIDNKQYDPYFILDVTLGDSNEHIVKAFRKKVKKYHPDKYIDKKDKIKYEKYFKILVESFEYIKSKRSTQSNLHLNNKSKTNENVSKDKLKTLKTKDELKKFNSDFEQVSNLDPNNFGYENSEDVKKYKRISKIEEYDNTEINYINQFENKKFSNEKFNRLFEYNQNKEKQKQKHERSLIHKTTDGFNGYNSDNLDNCSLVSSFNGLMITGDNFGERGIGYWGNNYSDYKMSFDGASNPKSKIKIPNGKVKVDDIDDNNFKSNNNNDYKVYTGDFNTQQNQFSKITYSNLLEKEDLDKKMVLKYMKQYDNETVRMALNGELEQSPSYTKTLQKSIDFN